jgi:tetratricopeptide (TPR) repeat protein
LVSWQATTLYSRSAGRQIDNGPINFVARPAAARATAAPVLARGRARHGRYRRAGQQALALAAALGDSGLQEQASHNLGQAYYAVGDFGRAAELLRCNVEAGDRESGMPSTIAWDQAVSWGWLAMTLGAHRASGNRDWLPAIPADLGYAYALQGRLAEGRTLVEEAIREGISSGERRNWYSTGLSEVCRLAGRGEEAWQHARQALDLAQQQKDRIE